MRCITRFLFGSHTNVSTPLVESNIPLCIFHPPEGVDKVILESKFIKELLSYENPYQWAALVLYRHPMYGYLINFTGEHETGRWSYLLKPKNGKIPKFRIV